MDFKYIDDNLPKWIDGWWSPILGLHMPVVRYGFQGHPLLMFPTAAADFLETERFFLIKSIEPYIFEGRVQVFAIDSINEHGWMDRHLPVPEKARRQALYSRYIEEELVPFIRHRVGDGGARIATTGASFGAFHAANAYFRRPDLFDSLIAMSGFYDLGPTYLEGYSDESCYFNNPAWFIPNLEGPYLDLLRHHCTTYIVTGQGAWEVPDASRRFSGILGAKGIPHELDLWGFDIEHDWPSWRQMLPYAIGQKMPW